MPEDRRIDYVELPAADFDAVEAFYTEAFGWTFESYGDGYRAFSDGRLDGGFYRSERASRAADGAALVILYARDLEGVEARVAAAGGTIVKPTFDFPGGRRFEFRDPHGNDLAVWTDRPRAA